MQGKWIILFTSLSRRLDDERPDLQMEGEQPGPADQEPLAARRLQAGQLQQPPVRRRHGHRWVRESAAFCHYKSNPVTDGTRGPCSKARE